MNFTSSVKEELIAHGISDACCKQAALAAFVRTTGTIGYISGALSFEISTESEAVAEFFIGILEEQYGAEIVFTGGARQSARRERITFECRGQTAVHILAELGIAKSSAEGLELKTEVDKYLIENNCCVISYIKGAFLGGGSCVIPTERSKSGGYHLEIVFSSMLAAQSLVEMLLRYDLSAKLAKRKESVIVYLKSSAQISDLLALMGASRAVLKLTDVLVKKSRANDINRAVNCQTGNLIKQFDASIKQLRAIENLKAAGKLSGLSPALKKAALCRLENNEMSLSELAEKLNISKSCLNHRLRKITEISEKLKGETINEE